MSDSCNHDCASCSKDCGERKPADMRAKQNSLSHVRRVVAVASGKGGVGKSLVTGLLAVQSQRNGLRTAILDADITGPSIPKMFGITQPATGCDQGIFPEKSSTGIQVMSLSMLLQNPSDPVLWRGPILAGAVKQFWTDVIWDEVDCMYVDMPPGTGDVPLTVYQALPIDGVVIVMTPQDLVSTIVAKAIKMAEMMKIPVLGLVENMSWLECPDCGKKISLFGESHADQLAEQFHIPVLARIPLNAELTTLCDNGQIEKTDVQLEVGAIG